MNDKILKVLQTESEQYIKDTKLLMEALLFYAEEKNYNELAFNNPENLPYGNSDFTIMFDKGSKAREAIKKFLHE